MNVAQGLALIAEYDALVKGAGNFESAAAEDQEFVSLEDFQWEMLELAIDRKVVAVGTEDGPTFDDIRLFGSLAQVYLQLARAELAGEVGR
jgi:hypothetical protein